MKKQLYKFQEAALDEIKGRDNVLLGWQMGTGKTLSSINLAEYWNSDILVCLVLKSTVGQWIDELSEQTDRKVFNGYKKTKTDGIKPFIQHEGRKAIVIGYDAFKVKSADDLRAYINSNFENVTMICDESSLIGHMDSERTKAVMRTKAKHKAMLSGTPATGGKMENLLPTMHMLGWKMAYKDFLKEYCLVKQWRDPARPWVVIDIIKGYKNIEGLRKRLQTVGASFLTMEEAGVQLPSLTEKEIKIKQTKEYKAFMKNGIVDIGGETLVGDVLLKKMLYGRQLCSVYNKEKFDALADLLNEAGDEKVIVFYNWNAELDALKNLCKKLGKPVSVVNGKEKDLRAYDEDAGAVVLAQYQAASMGLNLQKSRICVFFSPCLSYSDYEQAKARVHRIGQDRPCLSYTLICDDSIETHIMETLKQRQDYSERLFADEYKIKEAEMPAAV